MSKKPRYNDVLAELVDLLENARRAAARSINAVMTATYWEMGRRIVEFEQGGKERAGYGEKLIEQLSHDLTRRFGRGFGVRNLFQMRAFYLAFPERLQTPSAESGEEGPRRKLQTVSAESRGEGPRRKLQTPSAKSSAPIAPIARQGEPPGFPLPWSHYVQLLSVRNQDAREFYETEAFRGGWTVRQLDRQIDSQFFERVALSRNKARMLKKGAIPKPEDAVSAEEEIHDPFALEFLALKDEYSENELEEALIVHLESFLLELGNDFAFVGRQRRLRIDDKWYRVDLLLFHRRLRCLVLIDLKLGGFDHADAGQMNVYLNFARENWCQSGENPPVGIILCARKGETLVRYATDNLPNRMLVREYLTALPNRKVLAAEIKKAQRQLGPGR